jgi:7,8-dihydropterin-6-yl-methyl-4-(beta-D-ribofuranosyl)aminobenzene 5'-phosphate synthase
MNDKAKIIVSPDALKGRFFSKRQYLHSITKEWPDAYPQTQFYTSHCTGDAVFATLHQVMGDKIHTFSCGISM